MAPQDSPDGEPQPLDGTMLAEGLLGILRAGGGKPACGWGERTDATLVEKDRHQQHPDEGFRNPMDNLPQ